MFFWVLNFNKFTKISEYDKEINPSYGLLKIFELENNKLHKLSLFSIEDICNNEFNNLFLILISFFLLFFEKLKISIVSNILQNMLSSIFPFFISDIYIKNSIILIIIMIYFAQ